MRHNGGNGMRKRDAEPRVAPVKEQLIIAFPQFADLIEQTPVHLISKRTIARRNQIADELEADAKSNFSDTAAEAFVGKNGYAVILYYEHIHERDFEHFLFHEFGHVISIHVNKDLFDEAQRDIARDNDTAIRIGASVWCEFIAEAIAYIAEDGDPTGDIFAINWKLERLIGEAVNGGYLEPYPLAFYLAMMFTDPTIEAYLQTHPNAALGLNDCDDEVIPYIEELLLVLNEQTKKDDYYVIERETLMELGARLDDLWGYCADLHNAKMLRAALERLSKEQPLS